MCPVKTHNIVIINQACSKLFFFIHSLLDSFNNITVINSDTKLVTKKIDQQFQNFWLSLNSITINTLSTCIQTDRPDQSVDPDKTLRNLHLINAIIVVCHSSCSFQTLQVLGHSNLKTDMVRR